MDRFAELIPPGGVTAEAWDQAHRRVWAYLAALGVRHDFLLHRLVQRLMARVQRGIEQGDARPPVVIASEKVEEALAGWFSALLGLEDADVAEVSLQGRLALILADTPHRWHGLLLTEPPWPDEFVLAVRESYLVAVPKLCLGRMDSPRLDLGAIPRLADSVLRGLDRLRWVKWTLFWLGLGAGLALLIYLTR